MSFDLFYQPCHFGTETVERKNPFTGEVDSHLPVLPLSVEDQEKVREILTKYGAGGPDDFGSYVINFDDCIAAEIFANDLETGCMIALRGISPTTLKFLFDLLKAVDWILIPAMEGNPAIVTSSGLAGGFADTCPEVICTSPEELGAILLSAFGAWQGYRDQMLNEGIPEFD